MTQSLSPTMGSDADTAALKTLAGMVRREALVMAFSDVFLMLAVVFFAALVLVPLARRPGKPAGAQAAVTDRPELALADWFALKPIGRLRDQKHTLKSGAALPRHRAPVQLMLPLCGGAAAE